ncbi:MAG TPA: aquaporin [Thermoplasmata archaeon]|nr:aquaporin [Thermoplasmata archaeon]
MSWSLSQKLLAEFVGTFVLVVTICGGVVWSLHDSVDFLSVDLIGSLAIGFGVLGAAYAFGDISGACFNPAITLAAWVAGRMPGRHVVPYIVAQVAGAITGAAFVAGVAYGNGSVFASAQATAIASQGYSGNGSPYIVALGSVFLLEVGLTFVLVLVVLFSTRPGGSTLNLAPVGIALTLGMINLIAIPIDGASVNPARSFGPALLAAAWPGSRWAIQQDWIFWVAPIVGGLLAAGLERALRARATSG